MFLRDVLSRRPALKVFEATGCEGRGDDWLPALRHSVRAPSKPRGFGTPRIASKGPLIDPSENLSNLQTMRGIALDRQKFQANLYKTPPPKKNADQMPR